MYKYKLQGVLNKLILQVECGEWLHAVLKDGDFFFLWFADTVLPCANGVSTAVAI